MQKDSPKILLGMLISNGDCLMATVIARQIKKDYPGCRLTWGISDRCRSVIEHNPDVDAIWEIPLQSREDGVGAGWFRFHAEAIAKKNAGEFDEVFFTQIYPANVHHYDGTTRGTIYNSYPHPVTVGARPVLRLTDEETGRVKTFAAENRLGAFKNVLLFECSAFSGQSYVRFDWALGVALMLVERFDDLAVILSTHEKQVSPHSRIIMAAELTLRENAELTRYCSLLAGCSSGITWMATSDWAKRLPMVQFLNRGIGFTFASVAYDHAYWGLDDSQIIETTDPDPQKAVMLLSYVLENGIAAAREKFHMRLKPRFASLLKYWFMFFRKGKWGKSFRIAAQFIRRNYSSKKRPG